ncbi:hypothetical protein ACO2Q8_14790 [Larkinella sp. VNQ87]
MQQRIRRIVLEYYGSMPFEPVQADLEAWLQTLCPTEQEIYRWMGLGTCRDMLAFRQFCFRKQGYRLESYLAERLTMEEFRYWLNRM